MQKSSLSHQNRAFLTDLEQYLHSPEPAPMNADDVEAACRLRGMDFYRRGARARRLGFARSIYASVFSVLRKDERESINAAFLAAPAGSDTDWSRNSAVFFDTVRDLAAQGLVPGELGERATHDFTMHKLSLLTEAPAPAKALEGDESAVALEINPTLEVMEYASDPTLSTRAVGESVLIAYVLHPESKRAQWIRLNPTILALLRMVQEGLSLEQTAQQAQVDPSVIRAQVNHGISLGLFTGKS